MGTQSNFTACKTRTLKPSRFDHIRFYATVVNYLWGAINTTFLLETNFSSVLCVTFMTDKGGLFMASPKYADSWLTDTILICACSLLRCQEINMWLQSMKVMIHILKVKPT